MGLLYLLQKERGTMSLRFILGRSGSGKTTMILDEIREKLMTEPLGHPIILIVPEQMTFLAEYQLINTPNLTGMIRTQVYSFTRLAWRILQETGGISRKYISSTGLNMLIRKMIEDHKAELKIFHRVADKTGFIQHVESMITEFKHYCITPEELQEKQEELDFSVSHRVLADKLHDLHLVFVKCQQALIGKYIGNDDYLTLLAEAVKNSHYLQDAEIYIDGFFDFTPQEIHVIEELMQKSSRMTVSLLLDRPFKHGAVPDELYLFRKTGETYSQIFEIAQSLEIPIEQDVILRTSPRFQEKSLAHLERAFEKRPLSPSKESTGIQLKIAMNRRAEIEGIAREIRRLVMEGYRYQDIAILLRNSHEYQEILYTVFHDYEIPFFHDQKRTMLNHPFIELIRSSLEVVDSHWRYEPVFRAVKTELLFAMNENLSAVRQQMDKLENYVLAYGIKGEQWTNQKRWVYKRYRGLELETTFQTDEEKAIEEEINKAREKVVKPLSKLANQLKKAKIGREFCEALYLFLEDINIPQKLEIKTIEAEKNGQLIAAREHDQAWNTVMNLLDEFVEIFGDEPISLAKFRMILDAGLEAAKFSLIPPAMDQVFIADMEQSRLYGVKVAFVIGLNDGVLPRTLSNGGILSDEERETLAQYGLVVAPAEKRRLLNEELVAYRALTIPQQKLYISYPQADDEGKGLLPSPFIKRIKDMFPSVSIVHEVNDPSELEAEKQLAYISHPTTAIGYLSTQLQMKKRQYPIPDFWWDVYNFYMEFPTLRRRVHKILSSLYFTNQTKPLEEKTSQALYGQELQVSVSRMELFHRCPFSHFTSYGLRLREREIFKLDAPHIGDFFHAALKWIAEEIQKENLSWSELTEALCEALAKNAVQDLAPKLFNQILLSSNRYVYLTRRLERIILRSIKVISDQARVSDFEPIKLELTFGPGMELPPLSFTLKNGVKMQLQGRIDRVEKAKGDNDVYLRIIDYKSSDQKIDLNEVYYGLALQMLTYLDIVITHAEKLIHTRATPAGVLYFHVHNPIVSGEKITSIEELNKEIFKQFKMQGLLLEDLEAIQLMDNSLTSGSSQVVPVELKKDGNLSKRSSAISKENFEHIQGYVRTLYQHSGNRIISGEVNIAPYQMGEETPCRFCPFKSVCQFDQSFESNQYRPIQKFTVEQVLERMKEGKIYDEDIYSRKA